MLACQFAEIYKGDDFTAGHGEKTTNMGPFHAVLESQCNKVECTGGGGGLNIPLQLLTWSLYLFSVRNIKTI